MTTPVTENKYLPARWTALKPHPGQHNYYYSKHRFNVTPAGRRSGKTEVAKRRLVRAAMRGTQFARPRFFAAAPTYGQAKRIYWADLKAMIPPWMMKGRPSESELVITLRNLTEIHVFGMDKPERVEGSPWDGGILDEFANMKEQAWGANVRPALSDRKGWCDLIGVPEGRNHYYELAQRAMAEQAESGATSTWGYNHWKSSDILDADEIAEAKRDLDELTFQQEYEGSFVNFEGRAYYVFDQAKHCAPLKYDPTKPIILCFDFNVAPGVCAICQEQVLPGVYEKNAAGLPLLNSPVIGTGVIGEVYIPNNSNTPAVCRKIIADWGEHKGLVLCYGDATGGSRGTAKVAGSDWDLIEKELRPTFKQRLSFEVPDANPPERSRVNAVNSRLLPASGVIRMMIDGKKAPHVVKDLDGVVLLKGGSGEIDKKATPALTHISDGLGYYIVSRFPIVSAAVRRLTMGGV